MCSNSWSALLGTKAHSLLQALKSKESLVKSCFVAEFSCCVPHWNITTQYLLLIYGTLVIILAKRETPLGRSHDMLFFKALSSSCLSCMPVSHCTSNRELLRKKCMKEYDKKVAFHCHTNKYRSLLAALWRHTFFNTYAEIEMPRWYFPSGL